MSELREGTHRGLETRIAPAIPAPAPGGHTVAPANGAILNADGSGRITYASPLARGWLGVREPDLVGRTVASLTVGAHRARVIEWFAGHPTASEMRFDLVRRAGAPGVVRAVVNSASAREEPVLVRLEGVVDPEAGLSPVLRAERLAAQVQEALRRSRELESLMAGVAHDLRAPLMTIASAAQGMVMSLDEQVPEDAQIMAAQLLYSVGRMNTMIDGFLRNARAGEALQVADVDIDALVALTLVSLSRQIESAGAIVEVAALGGAHVDADQLGSVFMNLIDNAIRHRAPGRRPHVRIWAEELGDERTFAVADDGRGILPQDRERVLRLFERADPMVEGSGIGLAVCQRIVEAHGGRIWLSGNPQGGTTVRFSVPAQARST